MRKKSSRRVLTYKPLVDIVTVVYGKPEFLEGLYESLMAYDPGVPWMWIIVDNKSPEPEKLQAIYDKISKLPNSKLIYSPKNLGFSGGNNLGIERGSSAPYALLLNTDTKAMHAGWLKVMTDELETKPRVGVVGARLLYFEKKNDEFPDVTRPPGRIQHAGVAFNILGQPDHIYKGWSPNNPRVTQRREMNCVTGACLLTRKYLYKKIGGLDTVYGIGNFEDVEYCLRCRNEGYLVVYQPDACLYHYAGGSNNTVTARINEQIFRIRCIDITEYDEWRYY